MIGNTSHIILVSKHYWRTVMHLSCACADFTLCHSQLIIDLPLNSLARDVIKEALVLVVAHEPALVFVQLRFTSARLVARIILLIHLLET